MTAAILIRPFRHSLVSITMPPRPSRYGKGNSRHGLRRTGLHGPPITISQSSRITPSSRDRQVWSSPIYMHYKLMLNPLVPIATNIACCHLAIISIATAWNGKASTLITA